MTLLQWFRTPSKGRLQTTAAYVGQPADLPARWARPGIARTAFEFLPFYDPERVELLARCLREPDPSDLRGVLAPRFRWSETLTACRGTIQVSPGDPDRFKRWLPARMRAIRAREIAAFGLADEAQVA